MKLLAAPYGSDSYTYVYIRLTSFKEIDYWGLLCVLHKYGVYRYSIMKIISCIDHSSYECNVQTNWIKSRYHECLEDFKKVGVTLEIKAYMIGEKAVLFEPKRY